MNRREFLKTGGAGAAALSTLSPLAAQPRKRPPNIVFILADDLGYADLGCYGQKIIRTPNIDRLSTQGMRFTNAYSGCTVCAPSRNVLMTGFHAGHITVRSNPGGVSILPGDVTVAQVLKSAGYATGGFGKWGLGDIGTPGVPWKHGFDQFFGYLHQIHAHFYYPPYLLDNDRKYPLAGNEDGKRTTYSHDVIAGKSLDFIRASAGKQPFFCYVPFTIPHMEYLVPEDSLAEYRGKVTEVGPISKGHYAEQEFPHAAYAAMVTRMDRDVGRILSLIEELHMGDDTIVIFASDNGPISGQNQGDYFHSAGPLRGRKQQMYEGGIRVPMIARWPGRIATGSTSDLPTYFADFMPTAAEFAGVKAPSGIDGLSIARTLLGKSNQPRHEFMYWELPTYNAKTGTFPPQQPLMGVRMGDWKGVRPKADAPLELYDLKQDLGETKNVAAENPKVMARLETYLKTARTEPLPQKEPPNPDWHF